MKNKFLLVSLFFAFGKINAQEAVVMIPNSTLLAPTSGFAYNDCVVDMNNDHLDDVVRVTASGMYIDYQQPDGSFSQTSFPINFVHVPSWSICAGDLDNNGYNDLLFGDGSGVSFVRANAQGTAYVEYSMPGFIFSQRSTMADIDNDGDLDAFVCHDIDQSHPYRNDGTGNMVLDQSLIVTADRPGNYAAIWTDYDNDGDADLYITKCKGGAVPGDIDRTNLLYRNNGDGTFTEVGAQAGVDDNAQSWSTVFEDFDNDGDFDAFIVNHDFQNRFFLNNGDGTFTDIVGATGINPNDLGAWENSSGDFNNDGWVDILSEMATRLYLNKGDLTFAGQNLPVSGGGFGDLNNDGFLDVVSGSTIYFNGGNANNWLKINTMGIASNKNGIGARVEVYGAWGRQIREVRSGQSFSPMSSLTAFFGLGQATSVDSVVVKWPSGIRTVWENPSINTTLNVPEADCLLPQSALVASGETTICPGESVTLTAPDGFGYEWSNFATTQSITVTSTGNYSVMLKDTSGCIGFTNTVHVEVQQEITPVVSAAGETVFCEGGSVVLNMTTGGANPVWSTGETGSSITVTSSGEYTVSTDAFCVGDPITAAPVQVVVLDASEPITADASISTGESAELTAAGPGLEWYDSPVNGLLVGTGEDFQTPNLNSTTTYYVESHTVYPGEIQTGGKENNNGTGGVPTQGSYNLFDAWEEFTINTVTVYVPATAPSGLRTIQLYDGNGVLMDENTFDLNSGIYELTLNFYVPVGNGYSLRCVQNNLFRNTSAATQFPYPIGTVGKITDDFLGNKYYYYFYNWKVQKQSYECVSDRVPVTVNVVSGSNEILKNGGDIVITPNPASANARIDVKGDFKASQIMVFDATGAAIWQKEVQSGDGIIMDVSNFPNGIYLLKMVGKEGFKTTTFSVHR